MKRFLLCAAFALLAACASGRPPAPEFATPAGEACGRKCLRGHTWCMNATCPAKATPSCRPKCDEKLEACYEACCEGEKASAR